jgi:hypothetical protein
VAVLPAVNALVSVRDEDRDYRSRVEDVYGDTVVLARPLDLPLGHRFSIGSQLLVSWTGERGLFVLPTTLIQQQREGVVSLWVVKASGQGWVEQRRAYVRAEVAGPVMLRLVTIEAEAATEQGAALGAHSAPAAHTADEPPVEVRGQLVDLSEAALRCVVPQESPLGDSDVGTLLLARFTVDGIEFALPGVLQRAAPNALRPELREVVVLFEQPVRQATELRRIVYALQLKERLTR